MEDAKVDFVVQSDIDRRDEDTIIGGRCPKRVKDVDGVGAIGVDYESINAELGKKLSKIVKHSADGKGFEEEYMFGSTY